MSQKVLIADDEFLIRWSLTEALAEEGYEVDAVEDGKRALEEIGSRAFDFIITDLVMPGADGWEVLKQAKEIYPKAKVVIITAYGAHDTEAVAKERGAFGYIEKPEIIDKIKNLLKSIRPNNYNHGMPN